MSVRTQKTLELLLSNTRIMGKAVALKKGTNVPIKVKVSQKKIGSGRWKRELITGNEFPEEGFVMAIRIKKSGPYVYHNNIGYISLAGKGKCRGCSSGDMRYLYSCASNRPNIAVMVIAVGPEGSKHGGIHTINYNHIFHLWDSDITTKRVAENGGLAYVATQGYTIEEILFFPYEKPTTESLENVHDAVWKGIYFYGTERNLFLKKFRRERDK